MHHLEVLLWLLHYQHSFYYSGGDIRLYISAQDMFTHPSESFLLIEGRLTKAADESDYANADNISLTNNTMMHLFRAIQYELFGQEIAKIMYPGQATTILGLKYPELYKIIERKETLSVGYRMIQCDNASIPQSVSFSWRISIKSSPEVPRFIIVGFQTDKSGDQEQNPSTFDNVNVRNIYAMLNKNKYPTLDYNLSFPAQQLSRAYGDAAEFRSKFFNMNELISDPNFAPAEYKTL